MSIGLLKVCELSFGSLMMGELGKMSFETLKFGNLRNVEIG